MAKKASPEKKSSMIVIDDVNNLIFRSENEMYAHFEEDINSLEKELFSLRSEADISESVFSKYEKNLAKLLEHPDEIWKDTTSFEGKEFYIYLGEFEDEGELPVFHVAITYRTGEIPSFVYLHFPTKDVALLEQYQRGEIVYDRIYEEAPLGAIEGDALLEGDELALGLYEAMLKLRNKDDIAENVFRDYAELRENAIEDADEIWRTNDTLGNVLVSFVKDFSDEIEEQDLHYIVVTIEDGPSNSHALLFSFPTRDISLVNRYRHGENLQAEEVVQESSH